jgi:hypothetical protein
MAANDIVAQLDAESRRGRCEQCTVNYLERLYK